ncbi:MAG: hypothetical protein QOI24_1376 [Acidobacteriota bacterium]|jgi:WD40 repeat protein|nr:hypothetical protein [Acidobacteriota bacterium]
MTKLAPWFASAFLCLSSVRAADNAPYETLSLAEVQACVRQRVCEPIDDPRAALSDPAFRHAHVIGVTRTAADGSIAIYDYRPLHHHYDRVTSAPTVDAFRELQVAWLRDVDAPSLRDWSRAFPGQNESHSGPPWPSSLTGGEARACIAGGFCETVTWAGTSNGDTSNDGDPIIAITLREKGEGVTYRWNRATRGYDLLWVTPPIVGDPARSAISDRVLHDVCGARVAKPPSPQPPAASSTFVAAKPGDVTVLAPLSWTDKDAPVTVAPIGKILVDSGNVSNVKFLTNDSYLAARTSAGVLFWTTPRSTEKTTPWSTANPVTVTGSGAAAWSGNGRRVALYEGGRIRIHQLVSGSPALPIDVVSADEPDALAFTAGGNLLFAIVDGRVTIRDLREAEPLAEHVARTVPSHVVAVSDDAKYLAVGGEHEVVIIRLEDRRIDARLPVARGVTALAFSPDGTSLIAATADRVMTSWDTETYAKVRAVVPDYGPELWSERRWKVRAAAPIDGVVRSMAFTPNGRVMAVGSENAALTFMVTESLSAIPLAAALPHAAEVTSVAFSRDGRIIASSSGDVISLWTTPREFTAGPVPRPITVEDLRVAHQHVVQVHASLKDKRAEVSQLRESYEQQAANYRARIRTLFTEHHLSTSVQGDSVPEIRNLLQATRKTLAYATQLQIVQSRFDVAILDLENTARNMVIDMRMLAVVPPEQYQLITTKVHDLETALPEYTRLNVDPSLFPSESVTWNYIFAGVTPSAASQPH